MWTRGLSKIWHTRQCHVYHACVEKSGREASLRTVHFISENMWCAKFWFIYGLQVTPPNVWHTRHSHVYNTAYERSGREASLWKARSICDNTWCAKFWLIYGLQVIPPRIWHTSVFTYIMHALRRAGEKMDCGMFISYVTTRGVPNSG